MKEVLLPRTSEKVSHYEKIGSSFLVLMLQFIESLCHIVVIGKLKLVMEKLGNQSYAE